MKLAAYEARDLKATKRVRGMVGMAMVVIAFYIAFWEAPPVVWLNDAPWPWTSLRRLCVGCGS